MIDPATPLDALPEFLTVEQLQGYLRIGRSSAYEFARQHGVRIGARTVRVPKHALKALLDTDTDAD
jgi:hypothetical protein